MLEVADLRKTFRAHKRKVSALDGVSFVVKSGEVVALLGANGAGKTTTMRMIAGLIVPDSGTVRLEGYAPDTKGYNARLGVLLDTARSSSARLGVMENLEYTAALRGLSPKEAKIRALRLTDELGLVDKRDAPTQTLSKGMLSKLALANALIHQPRCMLLDEPTLGLDLEAGDALEERIKEMALSGVAVLLTTHQMEVADRLADRVVILVGGQVLLDKPRAELISQFGVQTYRLTFENSLENFSTHFPSTITGNQMTITLPDPHGLYTILDALHPRAIINIEKLEVDLGTIFRKAIKDAEVKA